MTYGRVLFGVILAACCVASAMVGYGYEVLPGVRLLSGGMALLLGGASVGCIVLFIIGYHIDKK